MFWQWQGAFPTMDFVSRLWGSGQGSFDFRHLPPEWDLFWLARVRHDRIIVFCSFTGLRTWIPHLTAEIAWLRQPWTSIIITMLRPRFCYDCSYYCDHCDTSCNLRYLLLRTSVYSIATRIPPNRPRRSVLRCICCSFAFWFCSLQCGIVV